MNVGKYNVTLHKRTQHSSVVSKAKCPLCAQHCSTLENLRVHLKRNHKKAKMSADNQTVNGNEIVWELVARRGFEKPDFDEDVSLRKLFPGCRYNPSLAPDDVPTPDIVPAPHETDKNAIQEVIRPVNPVTPNFEFVEIPAPKFSVNSPASPAMVKNEFVETSLPNWESGLPSASVANEIGVQRKL